MIVHSSGLPSKTVKEALFVLIQHSLVTFDANPVYRLDQDAVLARLAIGRMAAWLVTQVSEPAAQLFLRIIAAGRVQKIDPELQDQVTALLECGALERVEVLNASAATGTDQPPAKRSKTAPSEPVSFLRARLREFGRLVLLQDRLVSLARLRLNEPAAVILATALRHFYASSTAFTAMQLMPKLPRGLEMPLDGGEGRSGPLQQYLLILASSFDFLRLDGSSSFRFDQPRAIRLARLLLLEAFIRSRYSPASLRLFRILLSQRLVEERQLAKLAMLPGKEVRERLYELLRAGLVALQEVPKSSDHAPSRTIFLWGVPEAANYAAPGHSAIFRTAASRHAHALINLRDVAHLERRRHAQLLAKVERTDVAGNPELLSEAERRQLTSLNRTLQVLHGKEDELVQDLSILSC